MLVSHWTIETEWPNREPTLHAVDGALLGTHLDEANFQRQFEQPMVEDSADTLLFVYPKAA